MGEKLTAVTMKTLATKLGVSVTTVSNAYSKPDRLSTELRGQILATAKELGYCGPSAAGRALRSGKTDVCGFLFHGGVSHAFSDPYSIMLLSGLSEAVEEYGASVLLLRAPAAEEATNQMLQRAAIDALVVGCTAGQQLGIEQLQQRGVRIVSTEPSRDGDWVTINDAKAGRLIGKHLARLGHRHVVVIASGAAKGGSEAFDYSPDGVDDQLFAGTYESERIRGLWETMPGARITVAFAGHGIRGSGRVAAAQVLDVQDRPTAIVALSDVLALGAWDAAQERGLTPGRDLSISGFDDIPDAGFLGITTVRQPIAEKGRLIGRLAMDPDYPTRQITLPIELIVRSSTGPAPKN
jgi:DNA-binding LacI/PurR family transcriptional regulator